MVFTLLHYPLALLINKLSRNRLKLDYLVLATFLPDIEIPVLFILKKFPPRLILHSIIGAISLSFPVILLLWPFYRFTVFKILKIELTIDSLKRLFIASIIGPISHVFLDAFHHNYNPLIWPISPENVDILILFNDWALASVVLNGVFLIATLLIFLGTYSSNKSIKETIRVLISS